MGPWSQYICANPANNYTGSASTIILSGLTRRTPPSASWWTEATVFIMQCFPREAVSSPTPRPRACQVVLHSPNVPIGCSSTLHNGSSCCCLVSNKLLSQICLFATFMVHQLAALESDAYFVTRDCFVSDISPNQYKYIRSALWISKSNLFALLQ
jgi:hypothetical protein